MTARRRSSVLIALLTAALLVGMTAPATAAGTPRARHYRTGGPITLDTNLLSKSGASAWAIDEYLRARTPLPRLGSAFLAAERKYGVNARFLLAVALHESGWGTSRIARVKRNLFGLNAYDRDPGRYASAFRSFGAGIIATARFMKDAYLTPGGRWWSGRPTLRSMQRYWSSSGRWGEGVSRIARSIRLATLSGRHIRFSEPAVRGRVHGSDRVSVRLQWTGGAIPAGIEFRATWEPITLDTDGATTGDASGAAHPVSATARRTASTAHAITLAVAAPEQPGRYRLQLSMLDIDGQPLPRADRISIPVTDVRVWADRAVSVDLRPGPDGAGVTVRITNTGREAIPALPGWAPSAPHDSEADALRSVVTVTASNGGATPDGVTLLAAPLPEDLAPGASVTFDVPGIDAATGRATSWIAVDLRVADDPAWLAAYLPVGAWRSGTTFGPLSHQVLAASAGNPGSLPPVTAPVATPAPTASPAPAPTASPAPAPTARPVPTPTPKPAPAATPAPTPAATPAPTPSAAAAPRAHVTRTRSEHGQGIAYRGRWGDAPYRAYLGGNVAWSNTPGATATLTFTGSSVAWLGPLGPTRGRALVLVDGRPVARVNLWRSSFTPRAVLFKKTFKGSGRHTLTIRVLESPGHPTVAIDGFTVRS